MQVGRLDEQKRCRIGVVAPASRMSPEVAERVPTLARSLYPDRTPEIVFHRSASLRANILLAMTKRAHGAEPIERQCLAVVGSIHAGWPWASVTSAHADSII
jgi:hypothetical protein